MTGLNQTVFWKLHICPVSSFNPFNPMEWSVKWATWLSYLGHGSHLWNGHTNYKVSVWKMRSHNLDYHIKSKYGCIYDSNREVCPILSDHIQKCASLKSLMMPSKISLSSLLKKSSSRLKSTCTSEPLDNDSISHFKRWSGHPVEIYAPNGRSSIKNEKQPQPRMTLNLNTFLFCGSGNPLEKPWNTPCLHVNCLGVSLRKVICSLTLAHPGSFTKKTGTVMEVESYCWWKKSCTSWYGKCPVVYRVSYMSGGAGFLPSTVGLKFLNIPEYSIFERTSTQTQDWNLNYIIIIISYFLKKHMLGQTWSNDSLFLKFFIPYLHQLSQHKAIWIPSLK